jgi:phosphomannomutase
MKTLDPSMFKAYDIRGIYPDQFDEDAAYRIARAYAQKMKPKLTVVGHDMRTSGPALLGPVMQGIMDEGGDVINIGLTTTPMYYYSVCVLDADAGIQITASHNPEQYNGVKLVGPKAIPAIDYVSNSELYDIANSGDFPKPAQTGKVRETLYMVDRYVHDVLAAGGVNDFGGMKLAVDDGNGMDGIVLPRLFMNTNCEVYPLFWNLDGRFPNHEANPLKEETLSYLKDTVKSFGIQLGVAYDGDGDRAGFVDENGKRISGDIVTAILAKEMLKERPGATIIYDVRSSRAVPEEIEKAGGKPLMWKVGHAFIKAKMRETGAYFGGELSCHYYYNKFHITDNGDLTMLTMIRTLLSEGKTLSELAKPIMRYFHSPEINFQVTNIPDILAKVKSHYQDGKVTELDGLRVDYPDWWFNLRPSQTEPLLRLNVEADTQNNMRQKIADIEKLIGAKGTS